jgi:hypothetical protein
VLYLRTILNGFFFSKKKSFWLVKNTKYVKLRKEKKERKQKEKRHDIETKD